MESGKNVMALFHSRCVIDFVVPRLSDLFESNRLAFIVASCVVFWPRAVCCSFLWHKAVAKVSVARETLRLTSIASFSFSFS
jgi:hypothetical protein